MFFIQELNLNRSVCMAAISSKYSEPLLAIPTNEQTLVEKSMSENLTDEFRHIQTLILYICICSYLLLHLGITNLTNLCYKYTVVHKKIVVISLTIRIEINF